MDSFTSVIAFPLADAFVLVSAQIMPGEGSIHAEAAEMHVADRYYTLQLQEPCVSFLHPLFHMQHRDTDIHSLSLSLSLFFFLSLALSLSLSDLSELIKAATKDSHTRAENTELMRSYVRGQVSPSQYKVRCTPP